MFKQYFLYLLRWQASTFILAPVLAILTTLNPWVAASIANLIGGLIFFWIDKFIFKNSKYSFPIWQIEEDITCVDCGRQARGYRLVKTDKYDRTKEIPQFRCEECSRNKIEKLTKEGKV